MDWVDKLLGWVLVLIAIPIVIVLWTGAISLVATILKSF